MEQWFRQALQRWEQVRKQRESSPDVYAQAEREIDRLLHGDAARGVGVPWYVDTRRGNALRPYHCFGSNDANVRVILQFSPNDDWIEMARSESRSFDNGRFPLFSLYITPDDETQIGGFEAMAIGHHNVFAHGTPNRSLDSYCSDDDCVGYGYSPIDPLAKPSLAMLLKTLWAQREVYPQQLLIGKTTHLIIGTNGRFTQALVLREANSWQIEVCDVQDPPRPLNDGPPVRGFMRSMSRLPETVTSVLGGGAFELVHSPLWSTDDPSLLRTAERWQASRTATFKSRGGEPETLTVITAEHYDLP